MNVRENILINESDLELITKTNMYNDIYDIHDIINNYMDLRNLYLIESTISNILGGVELNLEYRLFSNSKLYDSFEEYLTIIINQERKK